MKKIINLWRQPINGKYSFYEVHKQKYRKGDYAVYRLRDGSFLYTYKNIAINNLVIFDRQYVNMLATGNRSPLASFSDNWIISAHENIQRAIDLKLLN